MQYVKTRMAGTGEKEDVEALCQEVEKLCSEVSIIPVDPSFEPSLDALSLRSDVTDSMKILSQKAQPQTLEQALQRGLNPQPSVLGLLSCHFFAQTSVLVAPFYLNPQFWLPIFVSSVRFSCSFLSQPSVLVPQTSLRRARRKSI